MEAPFSNRVIVRKFYEEVWNERKTDAVDSWLSPSHAFVDQNATDAMTGPEAYKAIVKRFFDAFSNLKFEVVDLICEKDKVAASWVISGVHTGTYRGVPATNKKLSVEGISIHQIADGKIMDTYSAWDALGLMRKIGAVREVEGAGD